MPTAPDLAEPQTELPPASRRTLPVLELATVAACCLVVLAGVAPELVLTDSMPLATDLTGHVVVPWVDQDNPWAFLPGSWSPSMFNGFPVNQLYPWLPSWLAGMLAFVLPLAVAMKLVVVAPLVALPWASWTAARWAALPQPVPSLLALGTLPFLYDTSCGSCGGTITSAVNGEYSFAWAMLFAVLALGAIDRLARDGRGVVLAALLSAATAFSHPLPTLWLLLGAFVVAVGREVWGTRRRLVAFGTSLLIAVLLSSLWWIPFVARRDWAPVAGLVRGGETADWLLPASTPWELAITVLAGVGAVWAVRNRAYLLAAFGVTALVAVAAFVRFAEGGPFYSIRLLPFWSFGRWMLAVVGVAWVVNLVVARVRTDRGAAPDHRIAPALILTASVVLIGSTWGWWGVTTPATITSDGAASVLGVETTVTSQSAGVRTVMAGSAARPDYPELLAVQQLIRDVGAQRGCGTLMWDDGDAALDGEPIFGDPQVFWQSAIWTDGCVNAADGILVDSSMTAPSMAMTKSLVSQTTEQLLPNRPQFAYDLANGGASRMQLQGIRYYLTHGGQPATDAARTPLLTKVASGGPWEMWEVQKGVAVASLTALPAVFEPALSDADWESVSNVYFSTPSADSFPLVQTGPDSWPRATLEQLPEPIAIEPAGVTNIQVADDAIRFDVKQVGFPVIVRLSAYPGWTVEGAEGPYRATSNAMVVVPTSTTVTLVKQRTAVDWLAIVLGLAGLGLVAGLVVFRVLDRATPVHDDEDVAWDPAWDDERMADPADEASGSVTNRLSPADADGRRAVGSADQPWARRGISRSGRGRSRSYAGPAARRRWPRSARAPR